MPRLRHVILFFLCLFAFVTQVHANYAFIHNDHLGSASWITDEYGEPVQYLHYAPYGELIANQRMTGYDERFKYIGKERDWESSYDNFGARYYWPDLDFWTRVDPLADTYIASTPYMYCNGNPIKYIDPNGMWIETAWDVANVVMDAVSFATNVKNGNTRDAVADGIVLVFDVAAAIVPFVPGGAGAAIKSVRNAGKVYNAKKVSKANLFR